MIEKTLAELTLNITDGKHGDCRGKDNSGFYFISCKDVRDGQIHYEDARQIIEEDFWDTHKRTRLEPEDILVTNSGTIGRMAFIRDVPLTYRTTFQKSVAIVKPDKSKIFPKYLYYQLQNCVDGFVNQSNGAAQKNLLLSTMRAFKMNIHEDEDTQIRIASILSVYDDLIENNQEQIKLLEEAAQRLYKEWFVDLRFPGHETTPITGGIPKGWKKDTVDSIISLLSGFAFRSADFSDAGTYKIVTIKNVQDGMFDGHNVSRIVEVPAKMPKHCYLDNGDILLSLTGNVGRVCVVTGSDYLLNQRVAKLKSDCPAFTYCLFRSNDMFIAMGNLANGAAQQNLSPIKTGQIKILIPSAYLLARFEEIASVYMKQMLNLNKQIELLQETRDRLLPKLMNGEIEV